MILRRATVVAVLALTAGFLPAASTIGTAAADDPIFRPGASFDSGAAKVSVRPSSYKAFSVDTSALRAAVGSGGDLRVPTPSGGTERFAVHQTQVMQAQLAAAHPEITTWSGRSLDHPGTTIAMDVTPMGFHASVRGADGQGTWYVDPAYDIRGTTTHLAYYAASVGSTDAQQFVERETADISREVKADGDAGRTKPGGLVTQRVYRLALTNDPSYAAYFGTANVLAQKVTLINRVDQLYNDDLAIKMVLVNGEDALNLDTDAKATGANGPCGAHPCFDAADPNDPDSAGQLDYCQGSTDGRNRTVLGQLIGAANYDIGHIALGVNGGGIAYLGVVGRDYKGAGCTGLPQPQGDFYAIDYVAHEMGHEFGGDHTFNGAQLNCGGSNRARAASVEPGSGSSIMAYAGICLQDDLQPHSDPYFSQKSQTQIGAYTGTPASQEVNEVQTVSLRGFGAPGSQVTLGYPGNPATVTLTAGTTYTAAGIKAAVEALTGKPVIVAQWGYDPFDTDSHALATPKAPDATGFELIFSSTVDPRRYHGEGDVAALTVTSPTAGVSGFDGETAKGGPADNLGADTLTTNHAPKVKAPASKTLPIRTPFVLTGHGKDKDGDPLTYLWEENDRGGKHGVALVDNHKVYGPLFRVFGTRAKVTDKGTLQSPSPHENTATKAGATRYFPDLDQVLAGNTNARTGACPEAPPLPNNLKHFKPVKVFIVNCFSEFLPTADYLGSPNYPTAQMHFRLTARDGYDAGGGDAYDDVTLNVDHSAGPFLVTSQSKPHAHYPAGGHAKVTWAVNNTRKLARNVEVLVSTDAGRSWRVVNRHTANDGSVTVRLPNGHYGKARIMVKALGNYFYAVNARDFSVG